MFAKKESFYGRFFLVAQKLLPRHVLRGLMARTKEEKHMDDDTKINDNELSLLLGPILEELVEKLGEDKAREIFKEAASRAGADPKTIDFFLEERKLS